MKDNNFITVTFNNVGYNTANIQQIRIADPNGVMDEAGGLGWMTENLTVWEGIPVVVDDAMYFYLDPSNDPALYGDHPETAATDYYWGDAECNKVDFNIAPGQGVVINMVADGLQVTTAGEVPSTEVEFTAVKDNNFTGNPFAAPIDISAIKISDPDGVMTEAGGIGWMTENLTIWEGIPVVVDDAMYFYLDPSNDPALYGDHPETAATDYYWGDAECNKVELPIPVGQGVVINMVVDGLKIKITPPYSL